MIGLLVLQVVGAGESVLMANFFSRARGTIMPIFHVEATGEVHVLVSPLLNHIQIPRILMLGGLDACRDVWDYLFTVNKGDWSSLLRQTTRIAHRLLWEVGPIAELVRAWGLLRGRSCVESRPGARKQVGLKTGLRIVGLRADLLSSSQTVEACNCGRCCVRPRWRRLAASTH
jgi:hypothetical protein